MDSNILMQINEAYRHGVYDRETLSEAKEDESLTALQKIRKRNKRDSESLVSRPGGQTDERRSYHKAGRGEKKENGAKSAFGTMRHVGGPYNEETLSDAELADITQWVSSIISEGYDLDDYSDEELYEAYLDDLNEEAPKRIIKSAKNPLLMKNAGPARVHNPSKVGDNKRKEQKEELDLYDIVSKYLVSEGFCDSYEDADVIMANMSEEWRDGILDEVTGRGYIEPVTGRHTRSHPAVRTQKPGSPAMGLMGRNPYDKNRTKAKYVQSLPSTPENQRRLRNLNKGGRVMLDRYRTTQNAAHDARHKEKYGQ
jgi:hypothetical protein